MRWPFPRKQSKDSAEPGNDVELEMKASVLLWLQLRGEKLLGSASKTFFIQTDSKTKGNEGTSLNVIEKLNLKLQAPPLLQVSRS